MHLTPDDKSVLFLETEIKKRIQGLSSDHYNHQMNSAYNPTYDENNGEHEAWACLTIKKIYLLIVAYLELRNQSSLCEIFRVRYENKIEDDKFLMRSHLQPYEDDNFGSLTTLWEFEAFLSPFEAFSYSPAVNQTTALEQLESILSETHHVLTHNNVEPENETKVYAEMKWLLQFMYPSIRSKGTARLIEKFKKYNPDILIPEIEAAVEYKYIREQTNPANYIDELWIDASVYHKDPEYKHFFAVMFFQRNKLHTRDSIKQAWSEKKFPSNWRLILPGL